MSGLRLLHRLRVLLPVQKIKTLYATLFDLHQLRARTLLTAKVLAAGIATARR
jgi:hypothetical protein